VTVQYMTHLRTDLPLISDQEFEEWVQDIVENTHYRDVQALRHRLEEIIESHDSEMTYLSITKKCSKCEKIYPEFIDKCDCGTTNLEMFRVHFNIE
jgi:hypothetical protein